MQAKLFIFHILIQYQLLQYRFIARHKH